MSEKAPIGQFVYIVSYKHNGLLHRVWDKALVTDETDDYIVAVTNKSWVVESDGQRWLTREPAVCFYYKRKWFNIISMIRKKGVFYYCNLASPSIYDGEAVKNIDYDLDIKFYPNGKFDILDKDEFKQHAKQMAYPSYIESHLYREINQLIDYNRKAVIPFSETEINRQYQRYEMYLQQMRKSKETCQG